LITDADTGQNNSTTTNETVSTNAGFLLEISAMSPRGVIVRENNRIKGDVGFFPNLHATWIGFIQAGFEGNAYIRRNVHAIQLAEIPSAQPQQPIAETHEPHENSLIDET
jgi:hypothetical protein